MLPRFSAIASLFYNLRFIMGLTCLMGVVIFLISLKHGRYILVYPAIFPFSYEPGGFVYWMIQLMEVIASFFIWAVTSGVDSLFGLYALQICSEFRVLANKFENLHTCRNYSQKLSECMERHLLLIKSSYEVEKIFGILAIWLAITSAIIQCTFVFQASQVKF